MKSEKKFQKPHILAIKYIVNIFFYIINSYFHL